jgi:hypothetical protein
MAARPIKSLVFGGKRGTLGYTHREHRSKRGRKKNYKFGMEPCPPRNSKKAKQWGYTVLKMVPKRPARPKFSDRKKLKDNVNVYDLA